MRPSQGRGTSSSLVYRFFIKNIMTTPRFNKELAKIRNVGPDTISLLIFLFGCLDETLEANQTFVNSIDNANSIWFGLTDSQKELIAMRIQHKYYRNRDGMTIPIILNKISSSIGSVKRGEAYNRALTSALNIAQEDFNKDVPSDDVVRAIYPHLFEDANSES